MPLFFIRSQFNWVKLGDSTCNSVKFHKWEPPKPFQNIENGMDKSAFFDPPSNPNPNPDMDIDMDQVCILKKILDVKKSLTWK